MWSEVERASWSAASAWAIHLLRMGGRVEVRNSSTERRRRRASGVERARGASVWSEAARSKKERTRVTRRVM